MNVEAIFTLYQYEPYKSNDESYRLVAERVHKRATFRCKNHSGMHHFMAHNELKKPGVSINVLLYLLIKV